MNRRAAIFFFVFSCAIFKAQVSNSGCYLSGALINPSSTAGCGNGSNYCNLASVYVPAFSPIACGTAVSTGGVTHNKSTTYILPAGCTATVEAEFKKRNYFSSPVNPSGTGCSNAGMDGSPDALSITQNGGVISSQGSTIVVNVGTCGAYPSLGTYTTSTSVLSAGCANADGYVRMVTSGGTVTVGGASNRADEIITFTVNLSGTCGANCSNVLPITLNTFQGSRQEDHVLISWHVLREYNVKYYSIEKSVNAVEFTEIERVYPVSDAIGANNIFYNSIDKSPNNGVNYYRLANHDYDGSSQTSDVISVFFDHIKQSDVQIVQGDETVEILMSKDVKLLSVYDLSGRVIMSQQNVFADRLIISKTDIAPGLYLIGTDKNTSLKKVLIY